MMRHHRQLLHYNSLVLLVFSNWKWCVWVCNWINSSSSNRTNRFNIIVPLLMWPRLLAATPCSFVALAILLALCALRFYDIVIANMMHEMLKLCVGNEWIRRRQTIPTQQQQQHPPQPALWSSTKSTSVERKKRRKVNWILREDKIVYRALNINGNWSSIL